MQLEKISHAIQMITGVVVIVGVVLVIVEMRQTKDLARAQLASDSWGMSIGRAQAMAGENPAHFYSKLCDGILVSTTEERLVVHNLYLQRFFIIQRAQEVELRGGFEDDRWKKIATGNFRFIFETERGRAWWKKGRKFADEELRNFGDSMLSALGPPRCASTKTIVEAE
jgi:hypothetical protein